MASKILNCWAPFAEANQTDESPSQKLLQLSAQEREQALNELHGVSDVGAEAPEFVEQRMRELADDLKWIAQWNQNSFCKKAMDMSPAYVQSQLLKFLRAKDFDTQQTAQLLERHFALKWKLFGEGKLVSDLTMSDLTPEDIRHFKTGFFHVLPQHDQVGRKIFFHVGALNQHVTSESMARVLFMLVMKHTQEDIVQKKGVVTLYYGLGQTHFSKQKLHEYAVARDALPFKESAHHFAYDNQILHRIVLPVLSAVMSPLDHCKFRTHCGSHVELQYELMQFGISKETYPVSLDGTVNKDIFRRNCADLFDEIDQPMMMVSNEDVNPPPQQERLVPGPNDVVMGRHVKKMPGNIFLKVLLEKHRDKYDSAEFNAGKIVVAHHVYSCIKERGGRFIKQKKDLTWEEVSEHTARQKLCLDFRNLRRDGGSRQNRASGQVQTKRRVIQAANAYNMQIDN